MLALAAVLWFLYLLPSWMRRREYLATERNATRLQRAIRVMAETAEVPMELHVEATARDVARTERLLAQERRRADAVARAELHAAELRAREAERRAAELARTARVASAAAGVRRGRRLAGLLLLAAIAVASVQLLVMATTGVAPGVWLVLAGCGAAALVSVQLQRRLAARSRAHAVAVAPVRRHAPALLDTDPVVASTRAREWTPVPVPKPLYLERGEAPRVPVVPAVSAEELLRAAAAEAERARAEAHAEPEVVPFRPRPGTGSAGVTAPAAASRFASMGVVEGLDIAAPDLDEVLRRRRSVG